MPQKIPLYYALPTILLSTLLVAAIIWAWTEPSATPPGGNVPAPINVGNDSQYKSGALGIGGVLRGYSNAIFDGNVGIGTTAPSAKLEVAGDIKLSGSSPTYKITNVISPTASSDVATKGYVDALGGGECYTNYGGNTCATGFTAVLSGYTTMYYGGGLNYYGPVGLVCSSVAHDWNYDYNFYFRGSTRDRYYSGIANEVCVICCK